MTKIKVMLNVDPTERLIVDFYIFGKKKKKKKKKKNHLFILNIARVEPILLASIWILVS